MVELQQQMVLIQEQITYPFNEEQELVKKCNNFNSLIDENMTDIKGQIRKITDIYVANLDILDEMGHLIQQQTEKINSSDGEEFIAVQGIVSSNLESFTRMAINIRENFESAVEEMKTRYTNTFHDIFSKAEQSIKPYDESTENPAQESRSSVQESRSVDPSPDFPDDEIDVLGPSASKKPKREEEITTDDDTILLGEETTLAKTSIKKGTAKSRKSSAPHFDDDKMDGMP